MYGMELEQLVFYAVYLRNKRFGCAYIRPIVEDLFLMVDLEPYQLQGFRQRVRRVLKKFVKNNVLSEHLGELSIKKTARVYYKLKKGLIMVNAGENSMRNMMLQQVLLTAGGIDNVTKMVGGFLIGNQKGIIAFMEKRREALLLQNEIPEEFKDKIQFATTFAKDTILVIEQAIAKIDGEFKIIILNTYPLDQFMDIIKQQVRDANKNDNKGGGNGINESPKQ